MQDVECLVEERCAPGHSLVNSDSFLELRLGRLESLGSLVGESIRADDDHLYLVFCGFPFPGHLLLQCLQYPGKAQLPVPVTAVVCATISWCKPVPLNGAVVA